MTLEKFRILHSTLIEHYQFIEAHLEGIYAAISGKPIWNGLKDVERDSLSHIVRDIRTLESEKNISVFTDDEYEAMKLIFQRRNFWCHNCYFDMVFDRKTGNPKNVDIQKMLNDLKEAEEMRETLFERKLQLLQKNQSTLLSL